VQAILHNQLRRGVNPVVEAADLIHPLLSQPVLEAVLPIATWDLVRGGRERGLARAVFADRVPEAILARRSKGQLSAYFAKLVASNLDFLRPHLIDGCLADAGVLDRRALEAALTEDALIWQADAVDLLNAAAVESWVRHWQRLAPDSPATPRLLTVYLD
jgi:asparagine synthase (glutamine-hydrolysing)